MRHGSAGRFPTREHVILNRFDLFTEDFLGAGSESRVYAMNDGHVLRIYRDTISWDYVETRRLFYLELAKHKLPFAVPHVHTIGSWLGHVYTTEKRMVGQEFAKVLPDLAGEERAKALTSYLEAAAALGSVRFPDKPYGDLLDAHQVKRENWQEYVKASMEHALESSRGDVEQDVPNFGEVWAAICAKIPLLGDNPPKSLVHGDYFPANVFINDDLQISGVGDFSYATLVGDPRLDLAGAVWLMGASERYQPEDSIFLRHLVGERWGDEVVAVTDFYKLYYSIFFSGCKADDPATYWWCVDNLRAALTD